MNAGIRKKIYGGLPNDEKKVIREFVAKNSENALKTHPKVRAQNMRTLTRIPTLPSVRNLTSV